MSRKGGSKEVTGVPPRVRAVIWKRRPTTCKLPVAGPRSIGCNVTSTGSVTAPGGKVRERLMPKEALRWPPVSGLMRAVMAVSVIVAVGVTVAVGVAVTDGVAVDVPVGVPVAVGALVGVFVGVTGVGVAVGVSTPDDTVKTASSEKPQKPLFTSVTVTLTT